MALKHFTDVSTRNTVAINPNNVIYIREVASGGVIVTGKQIGRAHV